MMTPASERLRQAERLMWLSKLGSRRHLDVSNILLKGITAVQGCRDVLSGNRDSLFFGALLELVDRIKGLRTIEWQRLAFADSAICSGSTSVHQRTAEHLQRFVETVCTELFPARRDNEIGAMALYEDCVTWMNKSELPHEKLEAMVQQFESIWRFRDLRSSVNEELYAGLVLLLLRLTRSLTRLTKRSS